MRDNKLTTRQRAILTFINDQMLERGYPPSVREIGAEVGLTSPSTVHSHLATLQKNGYLERDPAKPRAIKIQWDPNSDQGNIDRRPVRHVPLVGSVAAGTDVLASEDIEETIPVPADLTGDGELFMLKVRGQSMIEAGILDGDFVVVRVQNHAKSGEIVVAGIPGEEATVKTYSLDTKNNQVVLIPSNSALKPMRFEPDEVQIFGRVVTVLRRV
ncbi:MAG: transcriptional repressor LexA [Actinomycetota bacterium]|nr:transcriptional repressor LexA [Actinomycetota bacterium]